MAEFEYECECGYFGKAISLKTNVYWFDSNLPTINMGKYANTTVPVR